MKTEIENLFSLKNAIDEEGRDYFVNRKLCITTGEKFNIASRNGNIYFPFFVNGELVRWKSRSMANKKDTKFSTLNESDQLTFKMPFWNQRNWPNFDYLIITEGEFDCIALLQIWGSNVVSLPHGAGSLESTFRNQYQYLQQYKKIYLCVDMDDAGNLAAKKAMSMLSPDKYHRIMLPCKDANDWVKEFSPTKEDFEVLMQNAQRVKSDAIININELEDNVYSAIDKGTKTGWQKLDEILGGLRLGEVTVISAETGAGKTTFCLNLFTNLAKNNHGVWINSYEMSYIAIVRKIASILLRKQMKFEEFNESDKRFFKEWLSKHNCFINPTTSKVDLLVLRKQIELASLAYGIKYIFIDHLDYIHSAGKKSTTLENIDDAVREIHTLAMEFNVSIILVAHPRQLDSTEKEVTMNHLKGSSAIKQYADNIITLTRMSRTEPKNPEMENKLKVSVWKNRLIGKEAAFYLKYNPETDGYSQA